MGSEVSGYREIAYGVVEYEARKLTVLITSIMFFALPNLILTYNDRTVTHLHIKWGMALGPIVVGSGTPHLPPSRIHAPLTNPR